ncbi:MAG: hypothetical protein J6W00_07650 [Lentisphaeria bacterium]|nr:hypothetical protein [Lentisphaeria bacterium]
MMNKFLIFFVAMSLIMASGCSFLAPSKETIYIDGTPADATVVVNGQTVKVPAVLEVPRNKNLTIIAHKPGFKPYKATTGYSLSTIGVLDAIGCWLLLLPGAGLFAPGAWELMENNFYYVLTPENTAK